MVNISYTAQLLAARRAVETSDSCSPVHDEFAHLFPQPDAMALARNSANKIHVATMRHALIEQYLVKNLPHIKQVLVLGAGFDSKYQRIEQLRNLSYLELDSEEMISYKHKILKENSLPTSPAFSKKIQKIADWDSVIAKLDTSLPTFVLAEGFFMYQTFDFFRDTLKKFKNEFSSNLFWAFDLLEPRIKKTATHKRTMEVAAERGEFFRSYMSPEEASMVAQMCNLNCETWTPESMQQKFYNSEYEGDIHLFISLCSNS